MSGAAAAFDEGLSGRGLRIGIVQARFNAHIGDRLREGCMAELKQLGVADDDIDCVIRGETYHFELVCNESARGISRVQLDHGVAIANAILTVENEAQAEVRIVKGAEAARVAVEMALTLDDLSE